MNTSSWIASQFPQYVHQLQEWCRQPSISVTGDGMEAMATLIMETLGQAGLRAERIPVSGGYPVVYAERPGASDRTILFYNHYDVQPPEPLAPWQADPFSGQVVDDRLVARGVADNKGCLLARVQAVSALLTTYGGELPVGVKFLIEGEEEIGSPHLRDFVASHESLLAADACIWEYAAKNELGMPTMTLGNKGMCYVELVATGPTQESHSMYGGALSNPAWRLAWALTSLKDEREELRIAGFYDQVLPTSPLEMAALESVPLDEGKLLRSSGGANFLLGASGLELKKRIYCEPTCTICGLSSGYEGPGMKTVIPAAALAKVDFRLVPDQRPDDILAKLRHHLAEHGHGDIQVRLLNASTPSKTPVDHPFVSCVARAAVRAYAQDMIILPTSPGTGPRDAFTTWTPMPIVGLGVGHAASAVHGPNESIYLQDYRQGIEHIAALLEEYGTS